MFKSALLKNVKKIAILRSGALGDIIVTLPAIRAIKNTYPNSEIVFLSRPWAKDFLLERTAIDRFVEVPIVKGIREEIDKEEDPEEITSFIKKMQDENFDVVMQFQGRGIAANPFIKKFNPGLTIGLVSPDSEKLDRSIDYYYFQNETLRYLEVAALMGAATNEIEPKVKILEKDIKEAKRYLSIITDKQFIVLHPFAVDIRRSWPLEKFVSLGEIFYERGYQVIFSGSGDDKEVVDKAIIHSKYPLINSCGKLSLGGLAGLLSLSALMVSSDTGPLHLARAVGVKTVGIYWAPNLINWGPLSRNKHRPVICWKMECPNCGIVPVNPYPYEPVKETCNHNLSFVKEVQVEQVLEAADLLIDKEIITTRAEGLLR